MKRGSLIALVVVLAAVVPLLAHEEKKTHLMYSPGDLKWSDGPGSLPKGAKMVVLEGDPSEEGIFTMRLKVPANYRISPHWHPAWEHVTVIEGSFWMGRGEKFDESALHEVPTGGFSAMAAGTRHFAMTKDGATVQLHGMGPWQLIYVNPSDDPRTQKMAASNEIVRPAEQIRFEPVIPGVAKTTLWGDPAKGAYGTLTRFDRRLRNPLHTHPHEIKVVVISGTFLYDSGEGQRRLGPGSYLFEPAGIAHTSGAGDKGCLFFEESPGPFDIKFVK